MDKLDLPVRRCASNNSLSALDVAWTVTESFFAFKANWTTMALASLVRRQYVDDRRVRV